MPYRAGDDRAQRIRKLIEESRQLSARLMPRYWALLDADDPGFESRLGELIDRVEARSAPPEELERSLIAVRDRLARAVSDAPAMHRHLTELPEVLGHDALGEAWPPEEIVSVSTGDYASRPASSRESLLHDVADAVLDVGREGVGDFVLEVGDADGLGDDLDRLAVD